MPARDEADTSTRFSCLTSPEVLLTEHWSWHHHHVGPDRMRLLRSVEQNVDVTTHTDASANLPAPLVRLRDHPIAWLRIRVELGVAAAAVALVGELVVVGVYYLLFEVNPTMTHLWHSLVSDNRLRHDFRNVGEGLLGGFLAQQVVWNHYKGTPRPARSIDALEIRWHVPNPTTGRRLSFAQIVLSPFLALLYAVPGFVVALALAALLRHNQQALHGVLPTIFSPAGGAGVGTHVASGGGLWGRTQTLWKQNWDKKLMGLGASFFFGRRPMRAVFDDVQLRLVQRRIAADKPLARYHPPTFRARYNDIRGPSGNDPDPSSRAVDSLILGAALIAGPLAALGGYVLMVVAKP